MAVMDAGSRVNVSISISTNTRIQLPDCSKDISTRGSNHGSHHRRSAGSRSWNTEQKGCFEGAPALASAFWQERENSSQISQLIPKYIIFS